ncbi:ribosomal RNA processing protein 36 homolog [Lucilia sericata]|uniref:ribosomal RNA processing protein 36 homolog n=1 Tax=Lucilia sericata TaxID=13632 RepID=UPI0018A83462|nr:ribosomal RNA processing protein 36 homolog [Lucilia sericata]
MSSSDESHNSSSEEEGEEELIPEEQRSAIREDLKSMTFEEIMKLKEELGAKLYKEAVLGVETTSKSKAKKTSKDFKRLNKNRPREQSAKRQVPFLGVEMRTKRKKEEDSIRDPRFDERAGEYDVKKFKENYQFVSEIREKEVHHLKRQLKRIEDNEEKEDIKKTMQRLINKNVEDKKWHKKQQLLKEEQNEIQKAIAEGKQPHYLTKKERRAKELVSQFEELKQKGKLNKHLEKRRKKNVAKDRKRIGFD